MSLSPVGGSVYSQRRYPPSIHSPEYHARILHRPTPTFPPLLPNLPYRTVNPVHRPSFLPPPRPRSKRRQKSRYHSFQRPPLSLYNSQRCFPCNIYLSRRSFLG